MIRLEENGTYIPETTEECKTLASEESTKNFQNYYDDGKRTEEQRKADIYRGKLYEGYYCLKLLADNNTIISGVRCFQKYSDNGTDITYIDKDSKTHYIQVKTFKTNKYNSYCLSDRNYIKYTANESKTELVIINVDTDKMFYIDKDTLKTHAYHIESNDHSFWTIDLAKFQQF